MTTAGSTAFNGAALDPSIRIYGPNAAVAQDLEPEYIAVSDDSRTAWVTLQENNALAIVDLRQKRVTALVGLGVKDHSLAGNGLDSSDRDGHAINIQPRPVFGMYQPDAIASFRHQGQTYLITANEGDVREWPGLPGGTEASRVGALGLDAAMFPDAAVLKANAVMGRLNVTKFNGTNPFAPTFIDYVNTRTFGVPANSDAAEHLGPEGLRRQRRSAMRMSAAPIGLATAISRR